MNVSLLTGAAELPRTDLLVIPFPTGGRPWLPPGFAGPARRGRADFPAAFRECLLLYPEGREARARRLLLVGAGEKEKLTAERLRRLAALARNQAARLGAERFLLRWDSRGSGLAGFDTGAALAEGALLADYRFDRLKAADPERKKKGKPARGTFLLLGGSRVCAEARRGFRQGRDGARGQNLARLLGDLPPNLLGPAEFAARARSLARRKGFRCTVLGEKEMGRLGMEAFLAVGRGSARESRMVVLQSRPGARRTLCLVGKGVTFDAGGISLKRAPGMESMRFDMCGAAAVLGFFEALAKEKAGSLPWNVVGIMGLAENLPDGRAQRPGDVVRVLDGTTVEVLNTDAEGRLVLADCIAWARRRLKPAPEAIIDLATLTGACLVALGKEAAGLLATHDGLAEAVLRAGEATGERCWRLPLWEEYGDLIQGTVADLQNIGKAGEGAGTITAGAFLAHFAGDTPFAHLDIAHTADGGRKRDYYKGGAQGLGVRLLLRLLLEGRSPWCE